MISGLGSHNDSNSSSSSSSSSTTYSDSTSREQSVTLRKLAALRFRINSISLPDSSPSSSQDPAGSASPPCSHASAKQRRPSLHVVAWPDRRAGVGDRVEALRAYGSDSTRTPSKVEANMEAIPPGRMDAAMGFSHQRGTAGPKRATLFGGTILVTPRGISGPPRASSGAPLAQGAVP